jgi:vancomycin resistance protein YoaR
MKKGIILLFIICASLLFLGFIDIPTESVNFTLVYQGNSWSFSGESLGLTYNTNDDTTVDQVYSLYKVDQAKMLATLQPMLKRINKAPVEASFKLTEGIKFNVTTSEKGKKVNTDKLLTYIQNKALTGGTINLPVEEIMPKLTTADLKAKAPKGFVSTYTTTYANNANRIINVKNAARMLDGRVIAPGETFSFNEKVGQRTVDNGYKDAFIIVNNKFIPDTGGGVCQVSSTLYNAVLLADLKVTERYNHSLRTTYVPLGRDAAVFWGQKDFKFVNTTNTYMVIRTKAANQKLTISLYGDPNQVKGKKISFQTVINETLKPTIEKVEDASLAQGKTSTTTRGQNGYKSITYMFVRKNGILDKRVLSQDYYKPLNTEIRVGTKAPSSNIKITVH